MELITVIMKDDSYDHQYQDTIKLLDYGFDNFSIYPIAELEKSNRIVESPMFTRYNALLSESNSPIVTDENGYLVLPNTASFEDAEKQVSFYDSSEIKMMEGKNVIGRISYTYQDKYVGGANIIYNNIKTPTLNLILPELDSPASNNGNGDPMEDSIHKPKGSSLRPIIISVTIGVLVLFVGLYFVLVERPRLKEGMLIIGKELFAEECIKKMIF